MFAALAEQIRKTGDVGLITGPAGIGKTKAIELYQMQNQTVLTVTLCRWVRSAGSLTLKLWNQLDRRNAARGMSKACYLEEKLVGSKRLIIIDNAHRAERSALQFLFDLHDATGCPIALVGNPEVLDSIRDNDQMFSRIGICKDLASVGKNRSKTMNDWMRHAARKLLAAILADAEDCVVRMAEETALEPGHLRTLKKQAVLAGDLLQTAMFKGRQAEAFAEAGKLLVRKAGADEED
jgi:DNA transposition AAA+ family ATPase